MPLPLIQTNKSLKDVSTFGIGGPARFFVEVDSIEQMQETLLYCHQEKIPFFIVGKGSNCLFDDRGLDGMVIQNKISFLQMKDNHIEVGGGYSFSLLGTKTAKLGLSGLEFACGIPATVGGAIFMNAGASGGETARYLRTVTYITNEGEKVKFTREELVFGYRFSSFQEKKGAIVAASFLLEPSDRAAELQRSILAYRMQTQPYQDPSAGCIFRNPSQGSSGAWIEKAGLKGRRVGGAAVSHKHANFIVNLSEATAEDVLRLVQIVQEEVLRQTGIHLEMEVRCVPYHLT